MALFKIFRFNHLYEVPYPAFFPSLSLLSLLSADVTSWRNGGNGLYPNTTAPIDWDKKDSVLWKVETPVWGNARPIIVGDKLFYTAEPAELICADAKTGKTLWQTTNSLEDVIDMTPAKRSEVKRIIDANENLTATLEPVKRRVYQLTRRLRNDKDNERLKTQLAEAEADLVSVLSPNTTWTATASGVESWKASTTDSAPVPLLCW